MNGYEKDPFRVPKPIRVRKLKLPVDTILEDTAFSAQQQAILYLLDASHSPPFLSWLHRLLPKFKVKPTEREELWGSRADGQGMREIGYLPIQSSTTANTTRMIKDLKWLPDGKQISFLSNGTLYVVPAETDK